MRFPRATGCELCINSHYAGEPTDCNCDCGHAQGWVMLGGTWFSEEDLYTSNPYIQSIHTTLAETARLGLDDAGMEARFKEARRLRGDLFLDDPNPDPEPKPGAGPHTEDRHE